MDYHSFGLARADRCGRSDPILSVGIFPLPLGYTVSFMNRAAYPLQSINFHRDKKITACAAIFNQTSYCTVGSGNFYQCSDALGAEHLTDFLPIFVYADRLQVGFESPRRHLLRPGAVSTKSRLLAAMRTLSHNSTSLIDRFSVKGNLVAAASRLPAYNRTSLPQYHLTIKQ